jgi:hypothetical protein
MGSDARGVEVVAIVASLIVFASAAYELSMWGTDRFGWAAEGCHGDLTRRFEVCIEEVSSRGSLWVVLEQLLILCVVAVAAVVRLTRSERSPSDVLPR